MVQAERTIRARLSRGNALRLRNHYPGTPVEVWLSLRVGVRAGGSRIIPRDIGGRGSILGGTRESALQSGQARRAAATRQATPLVVQAFDAQEQRRHEASHAQGSERAAEDTSDRRTECGGHRHGNDPPRRRAARVAIFR